MRAYEESKWSVMDESEVTWLGELWSRANRGRGHWVTRQIASDWGRE